MAADVREYVKAHPFGQPGISVGPDCSVEITGEVSPRVREETRASFERFIRKQRQQQSARGGVPSQASAEGLAVGIADGLARGQADGLANRLAERAAQNVEPGTSSQFGDAFRTRGSRNGEWHGTNGGSGPDEIGGQDWRQKPPHHATGEDMDFGKQNGARWQGAENGRVERREGSSRQFEAQAFERNGFPGRDQARWPEVGPNAAMNGRGDTGWSDGEAATGGLYRERTRSPVGMRRAWEAEHRPVQNGYPRESGWNAEAGWGANGWERTGWDANGRTENGWESNKPPGNARSTGFAQEQLRTGWGQPGFENKASFRNQREQQEGFSHWAGPASRPGVNWQREEAQRERTWQPNGTGTLPGANHWEPSTSYNRSWEHPTSHNGAPFQDARSGPMNGFDRNGWSVAPGFGGHQSQKGGSLPFEWQSHRQMLGVGSAASGSVPMPPFRDYSQVTDPRARQTYIYHENRE